MAFWASESASSPSLVISRAAARLVQYVAFSGASAIAFE